MNTYFNIRVVKAKSAKDAIKKIWEGVFDESHPLNDHIVAGDFPLLCGTLYLLFGVEACRIYLEEENPVSKIKKGDFEYEVYEYNGDVADLLHTYSFHGDYAFISKKDFKRLS
jgi:hypothetical protein